MSKKEKQFNVGDKFVITISEKYAPDTESPRSDSPNTLYRMNGFKSLVFDAEGLEKLKPYNPRKEGDIEAVRNDAYYNGARDAWVLAKKICGSPRCGGFTSQDLINKFGTRHVCSIMSDTTFTEAKDKVEAWRAEQARRAVIQAEKAQHGERESFRPGDIVKHLGSGEIAIVATHPEHGYVWVVTENGLCNAPTLKYNKIDNISFERSFINENGIINNY